MLSEPSDLVCFQALRTNFTSCDCSAGAGLNSFRLMPWAINNDWLADQDQATGVIAKSGATMLIDNLEWSTPIPKVAISNQWFGPEDFATAWHRLGHERKELSIGMKRKLPMWVWCAQIPFLLHLIKPASAFLPKCFVHFPEQSVSLHVILLNVKLIALQLVSWKRKLQELFQGDRQFVCPNFHVCACDHHAPRQIETCLEPRSFSNQFQTSNVPIQCNISCNLIIMVWYFKLNKNYE